MFGKNPHRKQQLGDGKTLFVQDIFYTIQGEGPFAGCPAVFVRLSGCNLACHFCFPGKTQIGTPKGNKCIRDIKPGDLVYSYDQTGRFVERKVKKTLQSTTDVLVTITTDTAVVSCTPNHPFLVRDQGWISACDLKPGDILLHMTYRDHKLLKNPMKDKKVAMKSWASRKSPPNRFERMLIEACVGLEVEYTGDGSLVVNDQNPDFRITGQKKVIEIWDSEQSEFRGRTQEWIHNRRAGFEKEGWSVLFLEVNPSQFVTGVYGEGIRKFKEHLRSSVSEFIHNGGVVQKVNWNYAGKHMWSRITGHNKPETVYNLEVEETHNYIANSFVVHNCDTDFESNRQELTVDKIIDIVDTCCRGGELEQLTSAGKFTCEYLGVEPKTRLVVLTGGEPLIQNVLPLIEKLNLCGFSVQIETAGTVFILGMNRTFEGPLPTSISNTIVCSPKTAQINKDLIPLIDCYKYIIKAGEVDPNDGLPLKSTQILGQDSRIFRPWERKEEVLDRSGFKVYVQACDEQDPTKNDTNLKQAAVVAMKFGYRLSVQIHKLVGLP